jgi:hypothetical protein
MDRQPVPVAESAMQRPFTESVISDDGRQELQQGHQFSRSLITPRSTTSAVLF